MAWPFSLARGPPISPVRMISIRKHLDRLSGEARVRRAYQGVLESILTTAREQLPGTDPEEEAWFAASLEKYLERLREDPSPAEVEEVGALVSRTLAEHCAHRQREAEAGGREQEMRRLIGQLTDTTGRMDRENRELYSELRELMRSLNDLSRNDEVGGESLETGSSVSRSVLAARVTVSISCRVASRAECTCPIRSHRSALLPRNHLQQARHLSYADDGGARDRGPGDRRTGVFHWNRCAAPSGPDQPAVRRARW